MKKSELLEHFLSTGLSPEAYMAQLVQLKTQRDAEIAKLKNPSLWRKILRSLMMITKIFGKKTTSTKQP